VAGSDALIFDAIRTPRGRGKADGALHTIKPIDLVVGLIDALLERNERLDPERIDDLVLGVVTPVGDQGMDIAKTAAIKAGLPDAVAGVQVNRFCASGLEAVNLAAQKVASGWEDVVLAGGVESMSRVPIGSDGGAWAIDPETNYATSFVPQGISADLIATLEGFTRADVDGYAARSQQLAGTAQAEGRFGRSIVPVRDLNGQVVLNHDEHIRPATSVDTLAKLGPSFAMIGEAGGFDAVALQKYHWLERIEHVHTAGNSSGIVDGAALELVDQRAEEHRARRTERVPHRYGAAVDVDLGEIEVEVAGEAQHDSRKCLIDLDQVEIVDPQAGALECLATRRRWTRQHDRRVATR
jgi:acetyl-CoA C-acetyltransferase